MKLKIKICGITNLKDANAAVQAGADYLGFIMHKPSPRFVNVPAVREVVDAIREQYGEKAPKMVGVFVNETVSSIESKVIYCSFDMIQLSGDESVEEIKLLPRPTFKAIQPRNLKEAEEDINYYLPYSLQDENHPHILVDTYHTDLKGGTGLLADLDLVMKVRELAPRMMLAGGLNPENVAARVKSVRPFAIDVSSGVEGEQKGLKNHDKIEAFVKNARAAAEEIE